MPLAATFDPAQFGQRKARRSQVTADGLHRGQYGEGIGDPVAAFFGDREAKAFITDLCRYQRTAGRCVYHVHGADVGFLVKTEGHNLTRMAFGLLPQTLIMIAVSRNDRGTAGNQSFEDFRLGIGNADYAIGEVTDMRRSDGRDDRRMRPHDPRQGRQFHGVVHAHFENAESRFFRHPA